MKLSEAIRLGAMLKPQAHGGSADGLGSCALLAASEAAGVEPIDLERYRSVNYPALERVFPLLTEVVTLPDCGMKARGIEAQLFVAIYRLNDSCGWTREAIADWVETIERQHEPQPKPLDVSVTVERA